jgi:protein-S-isoprenylcysteine O-methyltransferase Ste14
MNMAEDEQTRTASVKARQLALYLLIFVAMPAITYLAGRHVDAVLGLQSYPPFPWNLYVGVAVFVFGLGVGLRSTRLLYRHGGGLPWGEAVDDAKTSRLVTSGVYAYTRNPMVLGYSLLPLAMGVLLQSPGMALSITPLVLLLNVAIVKLREEPDLEERFGDEYRRYREGTPFLVPDPGKLYRGCIRHGLTGRGTQVLYVSLGLLLLVFLGLLAFNPSIPLITFAAQNRVTGGLFILICMVGLVVAVAPGRLKVLGHGAKRNPRLVGHHLDCPRFSGHVLRVYGRALCAGCTGLALGAAAAIIGGFLCFFGGLSVGDPVTVFYTGALLVALGLVQHFIDMGSPLFHLALNVALVFGAFMLAASMMEMGASFYVEAYLLASILFWVAARVRVSQEEHVRVCSRCPEPCPDGYR